MPDGSSLDTILKLVEIGSILIGGGTVSFTIGRTLARFETSLTLQAKDVIDLKTDVKKIGELMTTVAVQNQRMDGMSERLNMIDKRFDELRHGEGWVTHKRTSVEGEYP